MTAILKIIAAAAVKALAEWVYKLVRSEVAIKQAEAAQAKKIAELTDQLKCAKSELERIRATVALAKQGRL